MSKQQVQLSIGDKVKVIRITKGDCNDHCFGKIGEVAQIIEPTKDEPLNVRVMFKDSINGFWFRSRDISKNFTNG